MIIPIGHFRATYLNQSETFIWQYLRHCTRTRPIVLCETVANLDQFPLPNGEAKIISAKRGSARWIVDQFYRRVVHRPRPIVRRVIRDERIQLLHAHFGWSGAQMLDAALQAKVPLMTSFYGTDASKEAVIGRNKAGYGRLFDHGAAFLAEGPALRMKLIDLGCPSERVVIQRIVIGVQQYPFRRMLFVGRLIEKKGLQYALEALALVKCELRFQLRIVGDGPLKRELQELAKRLDLEQRITWLGQLDHPTVIRELDACDILLHPSVTARDGDSEGGAPTMILEAQACGVPVLSTLHADIPYITVPGRSALLSPERDVASLAESLTRLAACPELAQTMGAAGRDHVERYHNAAREIVGLEDLYLRMIKETRRPSTRARTCDVAVAGKDPVVVGEAAC
jgi:colanic acid/amylovoran biosynthesis glycosyltransferase